MPEALRRGGRVFPSHLHHLSFLSEGCDLTPKYTCLTALPSRQSPVPTQTSRRCPWDAGVEKVLNGQRRLRVGKRPVGLARPLVPNGLRHFRQLEVPEPPAVCPRHLSEGGVLGHGVGDDSILLRLHAYALEEGEVELRVVGHDFVGATNDFPNPRQVRLDGGRVRHVLRPDAVDFRRRVPALVPPGPVLPVIEDVAVAVHDGECQNLVALSLAGVKPRGLGVQHNALPVPVAGPQVALEVKAVLVEPLLVALVNDVAIASVGVRVILLVHQGVGARDEQDGLLAAHLANLGGVDEVAALYLQVLAGRARLARALAIGHLVDGLLANHLGNLLVGGVRLAAEEQRRVAAVHDGLGLLVVLGLKLAHGLQDDGDAEGCAQCCRKNLAKSKSPHRSARGIQAKEGGA